MLTMMILEEDLVVYNLAEERKTTTMTILEVDLVDFNLVVEWEMITMMTPIMRVIIPMMIHEDYLVAYAQE